MYCEVCGECGSDVVYTIGGNVHILCPGHRVEFDYYLWAKHADKMNALRKYKSIYEVESDMMVSGQVSSQSTYYLDILQEITALEGDLRGILNEWIKENKTP